MSVATDTLAQYQAAEAAVLKGLSYRIGDLQLTRADLAQIQAGRREWERRVSDEAAAAAQPLGRGRSLGSVANFSGCDGYGRGNW
jgi:hypothetical protein